MSISSPLLMFLLFVSLNACNARHLGAIRKDPEKKFIVPNKNNMKVSPVRISVAPKFKTSLSSELGAANGGIMVEKSRVDKDDDHNKPKVSEPKELKGQTAKISGTVRNKHLLSVSWRLPDRKRGEKQPGFNLDYSPPKTHPPVHN